MYLGLAAFWDLLVPRADSPWYIYVPGTASPRDILCPQGCQPWVQEGPKGYQPSEQEGPKGCQPYVHLCPRAGSLRYDYVPRVASHRFKEDKLFIQPQNTPILTKKSLKLHFLQNFPGFHFVFNCSDFVHMWTINSHWQNTRDTFDLVVTSHRHRAITCKKL